MKTRFLASVALLLAAAPAVAQKRFIIRGPAAKINNFADRNGLAILHQTDASGQVLALLGGSSDASVEQLTIAAAEESAGSLSIEGDRSISVPELQGEFSLRQSTVAILDGLKKNDSSLTGFFGGQAWTSYLNQPAASIIRVPEARNIAIGAGIVAVIDTGVDPKHPALTGSLTSGYDFTRNEAGTATEMLDLTQSTVAILDGETVAPLEDRVAVNVNQSTVAILDQSTVAILDKTQIPASFGHGTMVASLVRLVAPGARIMPLKAFAGDGTASLYNVIRAIYYAADAGADVINMSFSLEDSSKELQAAIAYANSHRTVCVSSAGNFGKPNAVYPAGYKKVEGVASTSNSDVRSTFSNYGANWVSMAAPGEALIAAWPGKNWAAASGTSFSTALVSGAAALLMQIDRNTNQAQASAALEQAKPLDPSLGAGRLDLFQACTYALKH